MRIEFRAFIVLFLTLILISFCVKTSLATNLSVGYGIEVPYKSWQTKGLNPKVIQVELSKQFKSPWYSSVILDGMQSNLNSQQVIDGKYFTDSVTALVVSARLGIQKHLIGDLFGNLFGGFGLRAGELPEIGCSHVTGHFGAGLKYSTTNWELGYEIWHMSDPLQSHDKGWNIQLITVGWGF